METSRFLGKVIGFYLVISGLWVLVHGSGLEALVEEFTESQALVAYSGRLVLVIGLLMVAGHNRWTPDWTTLITVFGWLMLASGLVSMFWLDAFLAMVQVTPTGAALRVYGVVWIAIGGFLVFKSLRVGPSQMATADPAPGRA